MGDNRGVIAAYTVVSACGTRSAEPPCKCR
jgi:hypothetical protein